jgi:hypothetical protein
VVESNHDAEIEARLEMVAARAHRPLTRDERALVRERIEHDLENRDKMRALPLANGDAPDAGFDPRIALDGGEAW